MWKAAVSLGAWLHVGWKADTFVNAEGCGRTALVERRAMERGAVRARFRMANMMCGGKGVLAVGREVIETELWKNWVVAIEL
jgi:hypothetical protein